MGTLAQVRKVAVINKGTKLQIVLIRGTSPLGPCILKKLQTEKAMSESEK